MKPILLLLFSLAVVSFDAVSAQQPAAPPDGQPLPAPQSPGMMRRTLRPAVAPGGQADNDLTRNYRLTITFKNGDKPSKEVTLLTASSQIRMVAAMEADDGAVSTANADVSGTLTEREDGRLRLSYQISASLSTARVEDGGKLMSRSSQYATESATGVLSVELGKSYEIFKSGPRSYSLAISAEDAGKDK